MTETNCKIHPDIIDGGIDCPLCRQLETLKVELRKRVSKDEDSPGCFLCKWILLDLEAHGGKLKGWSLDSLNKPSFPRDGEIAHLKLEGIEFLETVL